jgi:hypothetical protein
MIAVLRKWPADFLVCDSTVLIAIAYWEVKDRGKAEDV